MRSLRFVHLAGDGTHLVLETADGGEQFVLAADVVHALGREAPGGVHRVREPADEPPTLEQPVAATPPSEPVEVSPREIQIRVRSGESPADVAASLGTTLERIARFAAPVVEERLRIADEARRARARRGTSETRGGETQLVVFGEIVDERFAAHGVAPSEVEWDSHRRDDGEWVVRAEWHRNETAYAASWLFHRSSRTVTPLDDPGADLLSDRPIRPTMPTPAPPQALRPGVVAFPPMPEALTGPLPVLEDVFDQDAEPSHFDAPPVEFDEPPLPLGIIDPSTRPGAAGRLSSVRTLGSGKNEESDEERAARVRVPSWGRHPARRAPQAGLTALRRWSATAGRAPPAPRPAGARPAGRASTT